MKIKTKLMISFFVMIFLLLAISVAGLNNFSLLGDKLDEVYDNRYQKLMLAFDIRGNVNNTAKGLANVLTVPTQEVLAKNEKLLTVDPQGANELMKRLNEISSSETEQAILRDLEQSMEQFTNYTNQVVQLVRDGKGSSAVNLREREGLRYQEETVALIDDLTYYHRQAMDTAVEEAVATNQNTRLLMIATTIIGLLIGLATMLWNLTGVTRGLNGLAALIDSFAKGTLDPTVRQRTATPDEFGAVATAFYSLADDLSHKTAIEQAYNKKIEDESWVKTNLAAMSLVLQSEQDLRFLSQTFIERLVPLVGASYAGLYVREGFGQDNRLKLQGSYALHDENLFEQSFAMGEGLVGQCARSREIIEITELPPSYVKVRSGIGEASPGMLLLLPVMYQDSQLAVIELAALEPFSATHRELLRELAENCGIILNNLFGRMRIETLLRESQALSEELQAQSEELISQQEELRSSNERLEEQTSTLKKSEELLQSQQEELEQSNEELLQKTHLLEQQMKKTEQKNEQIERTKAALEKQTVQLALSSKYKSEFLANMSHELRTPLNSLLILSQMLMDNKGGNMSGKQVEFATTIHSSGSDLLKLIDEILDLSKIGAGKMNLVTERVPLTELTNSLYNGFHPISQQKGLQFDTTIDEDVPAEMYTDSHRVKQVLKNLLSNAFKFTQSGSVHLHVRIEQPLEDNMAPADKGRMLAFEVRDTGIGIPEDKQEMIFEAFQQVDGTTSRIYGGTGLGLAISRELSALLGGTLAVKSTEGSGSVFTLYLPEFHVVESAAPIPVGVGGRSLAQNLSYGLEDAAIQAAPSLLAGDAAELHADMRQAAQVVEDDRDRIEPEDQVVLIVEDDMHFARVLLDITRSRGFKGIVALQGDDGLAFARTYKPDAILLDIMLPVMDGWSVLHHLKHDADTRHIPVHVISVMEDVQQGLAMGAIAYLKKPATKERLDQLFMQIESFLNRDLKHLLVVEDDAVLRTSIVELVGHDDVAISAVSTGREAMSLLDTQHFDCMILDLGLPDINGFELLDSIRQNEKLRDLPIIIYTGRELDKKEELQLRKYAETIIIKDVKSPERLLDETTLFLHRVVAELPEEKRNVLRKLHSVEAIFEGKAILIVDDDIRNVFALSSALEGYNMNIHFAENGLEALDMLEKHPDIQLILMDMMMPEMDGYETMSRVRMMPAFERLPIIAITAKAMKEDRDKCIEAGASDYIAKPVNIDQLLSLMRVWLYK
ncbi:response regulator [Paenibacillus oenotherae]|uniref:histidine kinase n=1 Tax=Paenibacillus oenotherae TaxID=1435645 RepID=A0ABS7D5D9_9BACL|nr:response regulator [Paenibacillus oenotherae]MBW7475162.1 response regulator [Paenibacillus oenotherae]